MENLQKRHKINKIVIQLLTVDGMIENQKLKNEKLNDDKRGLLRVYTIIYYLLRAIFDS